MYIIQMADLHIGSSDQPSKPETTLISESLQLITSTIPEGESVLLCICGDVIDSRNLGADDTEESKKRFALAGSILQQLKDGLAAHRLDLTIKFCLGNHDITHIDEFCDFARLFDDCITKECLTKGFVHQDKEGAYYIFANSCYPQQYEFGQIDYQDLTQLLSSIPVDAHKILVLHHTILSMDSTDTAPIRDAASLLGLIDSHNITGVLHGHIHGRNTLAVGRNQCKLIGTGALFSRKNPDVNSQFNIIQYSNGIFTSIQNCRYIADAKTAADRWDTQDIGSLDTQNYFEGRSFKKVYRELTGKLAVRSPLYNVSLHISNSYNGFKDELAAFFSDEKLVIGSDQYTYPQLAEMWEQPNTPPDLYFNHGMYFQTDGIHGIELIAQQLKNRPTSSRAVLSTYSMETVRQASDGNGFLPSLASIQFSKHTAQELYVHMHLRALEASRFLKINICEILWLLKQLKAQEVEFETVNIVISAFRVQSKKKFNCFLKAKIDKTAPEKLTTYVYAGKFSTIRSLLEGKLDSSETITNPARILTLRAAMQASNELCKEDNEPLKYSQELIQKVESIISIYGELDKIHLKRSIQSPEETDCEKRLESGLKDLIQEFRQLEEGEVNA